MLKVPRIPLKKARRHYKKIVIYQFIENYMRGLLGILFVLLCSCNYFETKKLSKDEILNDELQTINWNDVDEYPTFATCDSASLDTSRRECFERTLRASILNDLSSQSFVVNDEIEETLLLKIHIDKKGSIFIKEISKSEIIELNIPELDSLIQLSLTKLPKIHPAIKRSQQVNTEFILPIEISIKD